MDALVLPDLATSDSHVLLDPRLPRERREGAIRAAEDACLDATVWLATSGTTAGSADVVLVALSKSALLTSARAVNRHLEVTQADVWSCSLPLFHVGGLSVHVRAAESKTGIATFSGGWSPRRFVDHLGADNVTLGAVVPTQLHDVVQLGVPPPNTLRALVVGGDALAPHLYAAARRLGWPVLPTFGMTECCSQVATAALASLSQPSFEGAELQVLPHVSVRVGQQQRLEVASEALFTAKLSCAPPGGAQAAQALRIRREPWWTSSDRVRLRRCADGSVVLRPLGRSGDVVKINGEGVDLRRLRARLERVCAECGVSPRSVALVPLPHARSGRALHLVVESAVSESVTQALRTRFDSELLPYERARTIVRVDDLPRTALGKVRYGQLSAALSERLAASDAV